MLGLLQGKQNRFRKSLRPTDVFLVGHPKSGNTWMTYMLALYLQCENPESVTLKNLKEFIPCIHGRDGDISRYAVLSDPRIFRNEWPLYADLYPRTLYMVRDPRAVLVSYYHHYKVVTDNRSMTIDAFVKNYIDHGCIRGFEPSLKRWDEQVMEWSDRAGRQSVLFVQYEKMIEDRKSVLEDVLKFLDIPRNSTVVDMVSQRGSFEAMRRKEDSHGSESFPDEAGKRGKFIRRGKADGWLNELPPETVGRIECAFGETMRRFGYEMTGI